MTYEMMARAGAGAGAGVCLLGCIKCKQLRKASTEDCSNGMTGLSLGVVCGREGDNMQQGNDAGEQ